MECLHIERGKRHQNYNVGSILYIQKSVILNSSPEVQLLLKTTL